MVKRKHEGRLQYVLLLFVCALLTACAGQEAGQIQITEEKKQQEGSAGIVSEETQKPQPSAEEKDEEPQEGMGADMTVYVCGAVASPGVYTLPAGARLSDAVAAAGGMAPEADPDVINLAKPVCDGEMLRIPKQGETSQDAADMPAGASFADDGKININTAAVKELMEIPGVGESKANAIVQYREQNGAFQKIEDIMQIAGIKEASFAKMEAYICVN